MNLIIRILVTALLVVLLANILPGVDVANYTSAILVAIVLGLLNIFCQTYFGYSNFTHHCSHFWIVSFSYQCTDHSVCRIYCGWFFSDFFLVRNVV